MLLTRLIFFHTMYWRDLVKKVLILFGGKSFEHDISLKSVNFVINNIKEEYSLVGIDKNGDWFEVEKVNVDDNWKDNIINKIDNIIDYLNNFDIVLPIIHGSGIEDGKLQAMFELFNINYVGSDSFSSLISYDKILTKLILEYYSIPQVSYHIYNENIDFKTLDYPIIVKPAKCGSSIGISVCENKQELIEAIKIAKKYDNNILLERYIKNSRELECAIIEKENEIITSNVGEILKKEWYSFDEKYNKKVDTVISDIDQSVKNDIMMYSKKIFELLGCRKLARVDFLYDLDYNKLYFNEINTMPGLTEISMYPKLLSDIGINGEELVKILIDK